MDNPLPPEDKYGTLQGSNVKMGSGGQCPLRTRGSTTNQPPNGDHGLMDLEDETLDWLASTELKLLAQPGLVGRFHRSIFTPARRKHGGETCCFNTLDVAFLIVGEVLSLSLICSRLQLGEPNRHD
ncbi:hypothetical protein E3U43_017901 [Scomber scombrus]|uniref:Uncharacterized protein n=1 Tax=Scomber scombrus TaxID=13677 RepID=A0AAV1N6H7_SCOSC